VLTYALLAGLRAVDVGPLKNDSGIPPADPNGVVTVSEWLIWAGARVPFLYEKSELPRQEAYPTGVGASFRLIPVSHP
jgi:hypothetical protein